MTRKATLCPHILIFFTTWPTKQSFSEIAFATWSYRWTCTNHVIQSALELPSLSQTCIFRHGKCLQNIFRAPYFKRRISLKRFKFLQVLRARLKHRFLHAPNRIAQLRALNASSVEYSTEPVEYTTEPVEYTTEDRHLIWTPKLIHKLCHAQQFYS